LALSFPPAFSTTAPTARKAPRSSPTKTRAMLATLCASSTAPTPTDSPFVSHYYHLRPPAARPLQTADLSSTASRSPAGACSTASIAATKCREGGEVAVVATTAATARRARVCVCPKAWIATSPADATHDRLCQAVVVEEESAVAAGLAPREKILDVEEAEARRKKAGPAHGLRRPPRSWTLRWRTTLAATAAAQRLRTITALLNSRTVVERRLQPPRLLLLLETTTST
jgi:hypothetical protein